MAEEDLPYTAEYAKSSRASCKRCKNPIQKDDLRFGIMIQSPHFDGKIPLWHHYKCFFIAKTLNSTGDIKHFAALRYEDQKRIQSMVGVSATNSTNKKSKGKASANQSTNEFSVEYAKSSRSTCKVCNEKILKAEVRVSKLDKESEVAMRYGPSPAWHHLDCFVKVRNMLGFEESGANLPGIEALTAEDQALVKEKLKVIRKRKLKDDGDVPKKVVKETHNKEEEEALKEQSKLFFSYHDQLQKNLKKKEMIDLLEINAQTPPSGDSRILTSLADCMAFGALNPCPECKGQLKFGSSSYHCGGYLTGWTKCQYSTKTPNRRKFIIPDEYQEKYEFLKNYKYVKRDRIFAENPDAPSQPSTSNGSAKPLENFKICIVGNLKRGNDEAEKVIKQLGGKLSKKLSKDVTCIITTEDEAKQYESKLKDAEKKKIFVLSEDFLDAAKQGGAVHLIKEHMLFPWGGDPVGKIGKQDQSHTKSKGNGTKSKIQKVTVQGKVAVEPDSGLQEATHVLEQNGDVYNAVLGMVDVQSGTNSFYKLQVLKHNHHSKYYVFRSWGRVGTTIGNNKLENFSSPVEAVQKFKKLFLEKTNNDWDDRANFKKSPRCFYPLDIDYGQEAIEKCETLKPGTISKLPKPVQELICLIFDVEAMKKAMLEFEIDLEKMPLGKLSKKQIQDAYYVLTEAQQLLQGTQNELKILDASNRFYTLIPHDFGMRKPPLLNTEALIKAKTEMLDSLLEIEVAYNMLLTSNSDKEDPIDLHYKQLKTEIEILDKDSVEFNRIKSYLKNTHAETHRQYSLELEEVFKINRDGEFQRYNKNISNKKLLWHGSRITNFAGILSQGLRIAPPEAPVTGYMFGKGIYFADMVSKSANYCFTNTRNPTGLLLLCEVALGNMYERSSAEYVEKLPKGKHSTKGLGQTSPDPSESVFVDGVEIPMGKPVKKKKDSYTLLYNEYIVYDVRQVNIKYLLRVNFNWK